MKISIAICNYCNNFKTAESFLNVELLIILPKYYIFKFPTTLSIRNLFRKNILPYIPRENILHVTRPNEQLKHPVQLIQRAIIHSHSFIHPESR